MREIVLDTETTGLEPAEGHRIVEIGALELVHRVPTGEVWHSYINPERDMPLDAYRIHELSQDFLADKPRFAEIADRFLEFIGDAPLVIHNAPFDAGFLNAEFTRLGLPPIAGERLVDTLQMARRRFAGAPNSLDALCTRFEIDKSERTLHGALVDCRLLAEVYLHLTGGRQPGSRESLRLFFPSGVELCLQLGYRALQAFELLAGTFQHCLLEVELLATHQLHPLERRSEGASQGGAELALELSHSGRQRFDDTPRDLLETFGVEGTAHRARGRPVRNGQRTLVSRADRLKPAHAGRGVRNRKSLRCCR